MSAFIVSKAHIDHLVALAYVGPTDPDSRWYQFQLYPDAGDALTVDGHDVAATLGQVLWNENVASVNHRYQDQESCEPYVFAYPSRRLTAVEGLKAIACYEYQSCEHPGWPASLAHAFCEQLRKALIGVLPGYEDAPWEHIA